MDKTYTVAECVEVLERLARTQLNLPVPMTFEERQALRAAAKYLGGPPRSTAPSPYVSSN